MELLILGLALQIAFT